MAHYWCVCVLWAQHLTPLTRYLAVSHQKCTLCYMERECRLQYILLTLKVLSF